MRDTKNCFLRSLLRKLPIINPKNETPHVIMNNDINWIKNPRNLFFDAPATPNNACDETNIP